MANRRVASEVQPHLLTEDQVRQLSAQQCAAFTEELDQRIVTALQSIDANFGKATRVIEETILPEVEKYGEASRQIWQSVKFWKTFFEVAAGIRLTDPHAAYDETVTGDSTQPAEASHVDRSDVTLQGGQTPSRPEEDSFDFSEQHNTHGSVTSSVPSMPGGKRMRLQDLSFDSPDVLRPDLETLSLGEIGTSSKGKQREEPPTPSRPPIQSRKSLTRKSLGPIVSTPARPSASKTTRFPPSIPSDWDGLADLSKTPLSAFKSPAAPGSRSFMFANDTDALSPPSMMHPFSHLKTTIARTPGKEAARMVTRDVFETAALRTGTRFQEDDLMDSPVVEPPSVLKNWHTRNYGDLMAQGKPAAPQFGAPASQNKSADLIHLSDQDESIIEHSLDEGEEEVPLGDWGQSFVSEGHSGDSFGDEQEEEVSFGEEEAEAPDTLFGGVRRRSQDGLNRLEKFLIKGQVEKTLHGGRLLESQPFEGSPLAGRDRAHGL